MAISKKIFLKHCCNLSIARLLNCRAVVIQQNKSKVPLHSGTVAGEDPANKFMGGDFSTV